MKKNKIRALALSVAIMPLAASAQKNVQQAFDKLIENTEVEVTERHSLSKDPTTKEKTSQSDVYLFRMPKSQMQLIKGIEKAYRMDNEEAYSVNSGFVTKDDRTHKQIGIAVGDGSSQGEIIGEGFNTHYAYSCFLAPEDSTGKYRYAYAYEWREENNEIKGKLVKTYATTLEYRQKTQKKNETGLTYIPVVSNARNWLNKMIFNINEISNLKPTSKKSTEEAMLFSKSIYELAKSKDQVSKEDCEVARQMLLNFKEHYNIPQIAPLIDAALENLK